MFRLERSNKPRIRADRLGKGYMPTREWKLFGVFPMPVHPSAISSSDRPERNMLVGTKGQQVRLTKDSHVVAVFQWDKIMENPGDPDSTNMIWGWKLLSSSAPPPERNHITSLGAGLPYISSVGL